MLVVNVITSICGFVDFLLISHAQNMVSLGLTIRPLKFRDMTKSIHM